MNKYSKIYYYLGSHLIVADEEINIRETQVLDNLVPEISEEMRQQQGLIFSDDENKIKIELLIKEAKNLTKEEKQTLIKIMLSVAYADAYYDKKEEDLIDKVCKAIKVDNDWFESEKKIAKFNGEFKLSYKSWNPKLNDKVAKFFKAIEQKTSASEEVDLGSDDLFVQSTINSEIKKIASIAVVDLSIANEKMHFYNDCFENCKTKIDNNIDTIIKKQRKDGSTDKLLEIVNDFKDEVVAKMQTELNNNIEILDKKKRTINYFTIAFMGRTKAGKSTFHKVLTKEKNDDIGVGKQRTTRYNRSWENKNLRIVDTPGIGAAGDGGRDDEEIAKSIIDQSDIVCYVVTNDSIQQTEFDFLKGLKEKNKPLFIILNIKSNISRGPHLKRFLEDPLAWKTSTGKDDIQGHKNRIKEVMGENYDFNYVKIIPLQLLAAKLCQENDLTINGEPASQEQRDLLFTGSNFKEYTKEVNETILNGGFIKKTLNVIDGCNTQIFLVNRDLANSKKSLEDQYKSVKSHKEELITYINDKFKKITKQINVSISKEFINLEMDAKKFADNHCEDESEELKKQWEEVVSQRIDQLNKNITSNVEVMIDDIKSRVEEAFQDINFHFKQYKISEDMKGEKQSDVRFGFTIASVVGGILTPIILSNFWNPLGWGAFGISIATIAVSVVTKFLGNLFKSKEEKRREAKEKLEKDLLQGLKNYKEQYIKSSVGSLDVNISKMIKELSANFDLLIDSTQSIITEINILFKNSDEVQNLFNKVIIYRLLQQTNILDQVSDIDDNILKKINVDRDFNKKTFSLKCDMTLPDNFETLGTTLIQQTIKVDN